MKQLNKEETKEYFDSLLLKEFREIINSSNVFYDVPKYRHYWNLICVLLDRLDSATYYLNHHINQPKTEEDFVFFLVYAAILKDGIYKFHENIYGKNQKQSKTKYGLKTHTIIQIYCLMKIIAQPTMFSLNI